EPPRSLLAHLGMTGQLTVAPSAAPRADHTHVVLGLDGGEQELRFRDSRRFGSMTLFPDSDALERFFAKAKLGPEPFDLDARTWPPRLAGTKRNLKAVLLDQRVVSGVGNIYADEALWAAQLHPGQGANTLTRVEANRLRRAVVDVLTR